jgi:putative ABC transport system permease protein
MNAAWLRDFRFAARALRGQPAFVLAAVATLAVGIGAATAIFSVAYGVSLRPLPYPQPDRIVRIYEANLANGQPRHDVSVGAFQEWREGVPSLESAALYTQMRTRFLKGADDNPIASMGVSPAFFDVLGTRLALGSGFKPEGRYTRMTLHDVVLSDAAWRRLFNGDPAAIGRFVQFADDDDPLEVVGVLPASFRFTEPVDIFQPTIVEVPIARILRGWRYDRVIARLRPGATIEQARAELSAVSTRLARDFPTTNAGWSGTVEPLRDAIVGPFARATWLLLAAVGAVLLIACLNVAGLLVARAIARDRETQVRVALGAGSWRLLRLWLAEAAILAGAGAAAGITAAWLGVSALKAAAPPGIPRLEDVALDLPALSVALAATLLAVLFFAIAPALSRRERLAGLRAAGSGAGETPGRHLARHVSLAAQCAGAATLIVLAVMLTRSFVKLTAFDLGWRPAGVLSLRVAPPMPRELRRPWFRYVEWSDRLVHELEATPGIARAAITTQVPLGPDSYPATFARGRGRTAGDPARWPGVTHNVTDGYFQTMGIRLVSGRTFGAEDRFNESQLNGPVKAERGVAVVTETTARLLWPGQPAIGQALWLPDIDNVTWREVIGVVGDIQFRSIGEAPAPHVFVPWTQTSTGRPRLVVRATLDTPAFVAAVRQALERVEPGTRVDQVTTLDALVSRATAQPRFTTALVSAFGLVALLLAAVGIYGTLSFTAGARARELGIRIALGATSRHIMTRMLSRGLLPAAVGGLVGLGTAIAVARAFRALLFGVQPVDAGSLAAGAALLLAASVIAALGPARRAARVDPIVVLRSD